MTHNVYADMSDHRNLKTKVILTGNKIDMNRMAQQIKVFIPPTMPLSKEIANLDKALYGIGAMKCDLTASGGTVDDLINSVAGTIDLDLQNGKIVEAALVKNIATSVDKFYKLEDIDFNDLSVGSRIRDQRVYFDKPIAMRSQVAGDWQATGSVGFDANLGLTIANRLTRSVSEKVLAFQGKGQAAVKGLLQGTQLAGLAGLVDKVGIPTDREGRVTVLLGVNGNVANPAVTFKGFGAGSSSGPTTASQPSIKEQLQQTVDREKEKLEARLAAEKQRAAEEAQARANEEKQRLEETAKQQSNQLKNEATKRLKKFF
jgi:hypothetical protein